MSEQQIVRKLEKLEHTFDALISVLTKILELSERAQMGALSSKDTELGESYTKDLIKCIILAKDEIDNMKDFTSQTAEYQGNFLNFLEYEENYLFSSKLLSIIDMQYQKGGYNYLLDYLEQEIARVRHVQLQFTARILCLLNFRDVICRSTRGQILHLRIILRSYIALGVVMDICPVREILEFYKASPRRVLSILSTLPLHQYDNLRDNYKQVSLSIFADAPLFLLCMQIVRLCKCIGIDTMLVKLLSCITLTPKHIYLGHTDAFMSQLKPDGLSIVVQPASTDADSGAGVDADTEHKAWEKEVLMLSVRYSIINFSAHLLHLGINIAKELDPTDANLHSLLEWYYGDIPNTQSAAVQFCIPIGYVDGGVDAVGAETRNLTELFKKLDLETSGLAPLDSKLIKGFCVAYEAVTTEPCNPSGKHSRIGGVSVAMDTHILSIVFLTTIRTKIYEKRIPGAIVFLVVTSSTK